MSSLAAPPENSRPADHPRIAPDGTGVLLVNLGTPDGTSYWPMRRYLKEFLSDRRVIEMNPILWKVILNGLVLTTRPSRSGKAYEAIWNREQNESPLLTVTRSQGEALSERLEGEVRVDWAMRYGAPSIEERLKALIEAGCRRILLFALYPQYSAATTATVHDKAFDALKKMRWQPAIRTVGSYHDDPAYIDALARSVETHLAGLDWEPEVVLASFHGLPKDYLLRGDPYHCQCAKTARLLRERLGWDERRLQLTFQSRFGRQEWLKPYTDETLKRLAESGVRRVALVMPGFVADCVETLEEIGIAGRELFLEAGGERFARIPCLNDSPDGMDAIERVVRRELSGWIG
ncbi:ferrochelatase [Inquilinus sp. CAU 1745]|uniref:ferrochelatase n=1 Tax=Inquilinus sp. CAU 1745 TaxID=3140369 RepID=UPI00325A454A